MPVLSLAFKSLRNRKLTFFLTLFSISISVMLLLGVQMVKKEAKNSFMQSVSGTDLIVGPRSSSIELLLYSVFHIGTPTNVMQLESYENIAKMPGVKWAVPLSMGDSHHGFPVMATTTDFYTHFSYANAQKIQLNNGSLGQDMFDVVIGVDVAKKLMTDGYNADALHGDLSQSQRDYAMERFRLPRVQGFSRLSGKDARAAATGLVLYAGDPAGYPGLAVLLGRQEGSFLQVRLIYCFLEAFFKSLHQVEFVADGGVSLGLYDDRGNRVVLREKDILVHRVCQCTLSYSCKILIRFRPFFKKILDDKHVSFSVRITCVDETRYFIYVRNLLFQIIMKGPELIEKTPVEYVRCADRDQDQLVPAELIAKSVVVDQALIIFAQKALVGHIKGQFWKLRENARDQKDHDNERFVFVLTDPVSQDFEPLLYPIPDRGHPKSPCLPFSRLSTLKTYRIGSSVSLTWIKK